VLQRALVGTGRENMRMRKPENPARETIAPSDLTFGLFNLQTLPLVEILVQIRTQERVSTGKAAR